MKLGTWTVHWTLTKRWKYTKRWRWLAWNAIWYDRGRRLLIFRQIGFLRFDKPRVKDEPKQTERT